MFQTRTADQLIYEAASILGKAVAGEALGQPEYDTINANVDNVLSEVLQIVYIGDRDQIPARFFQTIARLLAAHSAAKFSNAPLDLAAIAQHEQRLRYLAADLPTYEPLKGEYY
jgi:hypothetical protein